MSHASHKPSDSQLPAPLAKLLAVYDDDGGQLRLHYLFVVVIMLFLVGVAVVMNS
jgi:hypothetical protein